jgi:hypothetical protein
MFPQFDPSKLDPKLLMELSNLVRELPPEKLARMQTLMHNASAGFDVRKELEGFERGLPPGFREKMLAIVGGSPAFAATATAAFGAGPGVEPATSPALGETGNSDLRQARRVVLQALAAGNLGVDEAERLLFSESD